MPVLNATLLGLNNALNSAITRPECPTQHGLDHGDIAAIVLGIVLALILLLGCLPVYFVGEILTPR